ncbi:MAG: hypothetical protein QXX36_03175 [Candidatus Rehaiarchaeum fermentans]|nr:hypothetical protein [Candidatus Rehaiarchaeum fermentans]
MKSTLQNYKNIFSIIKNKKYLTLFIITLIFTALSYYYILSSSAEGILDFGKYYIYFDIVSSIIISFLISLLVTLTVYSYKIKVKNNNKFAVASIITTILPGSLCCTSVIPSILALIGFSTSFLVGNTGKIQSIFSVYGPLFIVVGAVIGWIGLTQITKDISAGCNIVKNAVNEECCESNYENKN